MAAFNVVVVVTNVILLTMFAAGHPSVFKRSLDDNKEATLDTPKSNLSQCRLQQTPCDVCGKPLNVVITAKNVLQGSNFEIAASVTNEPQKPLLYFLERAANLVTGFKFTSTYFAGLGYFIDSINGIEGSIASKTFWHISSSGVALECGASSYIPEDGERILFNFTTYRDAGYE
ncbi:uncharacterized protein LOC106055251 [Biomphalaria glabrata]|uniref:Uncharacterized protein LOC106055251 n=1 Tax=Biomphalaria glabrata TaxID=6526 RepID=A0A9W2YXG6_BIOGL|nr:uncharacterized protein LOC106055251 [Biomphalaria glabrata]